MPTRTQAIKAFLLQSTHEDLAELYNHDMEVQVLVAKDNGEVIKGEFKGHSWQAFQDESGKWKSFRIPYNPKTKPEYEDVEMSYDLNLHAEGIGMTGWDWKNKLSRWVAYDFDAILDHKATHQKKLTDQELHTVRESLLKLPWVTIRKSTGGRGLHIYVFVDPTVTENHDEHASLARAILGKMSALTGVNFSSKVDTVGGNMWVWHRKQKTTETTSGTFEGLSLIRQGTILTEIPPNWQDHKKVITGQNRKACPAFVLPEQVNAFDTISGQRCIVKLDEEHKNFLNWLETNNCYLYWNQDYQMLITHTIHLKDAHKALGLKGIFDTIAVGEQKGTDYNCFCFALRNGAWAIRRYTQGVAEHNSWEQDGQGWTRCFYNKESDLGSACRTYEGKEHPTGGFIFNSASLANNATKMLGIDLDIPAWLEGRKTKLKRTKDSRLIIEIEKENDDPGDEKLKTWIAEKGYWKKIFSARLSSPTEVETENFDNVIRHLITESNIDYGWAVQSMDTWKIEPLQHIKPALQAHGLKPSEISSVIGSCVIRPWQIVNMPFKEEYPLDRQWNKDAAQLRFKPAETDIPNYPTWTKVLTHCGRGLDEEIKNNPWAKASGILTGSDYLKCWITSLFQQPTQPLPYLFFHGPQNSGKSIFHEAISLLITAGYQRADVALTNSSNFNAELEYAILCVIEETDLKRNTQAYNKIKDWVTSPILPIHKKGKTPYHIKNTTHWVQTANTHLACPIFPGDTRITMIFVDVLQETEIPKKHLLALLEKEAPDFVNEILNLELPESNHRLNIPVISTDEKKYTEDTNQTMLEMFIKEKCHHITGESIPYGEFYDLFREWLEPSQYVYWTKIRVGRELPPQFPKGRIRGTGHFHIGNLSLHPFVPGSEIKPKLALKGDYLERL